MHEWIGTWRHRAACRGSNPALWVLAGNDPTRMREGRAACAKCPVAEDCARAIEGYRRSGIWASQSTPASASA